jgi:putative ABC transport system permease protein
MRQLLAEIRYAIRGFLRNPGFSAIALLVLTIGVGANTAVFSVVYSVLLKPLSYRDPSRLVVALGEGRAPVSPADYLDYRSQATTFERLEAAQAWSGVIEGGDRPQITPGLQVTAGMLSMLGVPPELGRVFTPGDDQPGAPAALVIGHRLWDTEFGADPTIIGRRVRISAQPYTIIGVMPPDFRFAPFWQTQAQMWAPLNLSNKIQDRAGRSLRVFGRLAEHTSIEQARSQLATIAHRLSALYPQTNKGFHVRVTPLLETVAAPVRPTLLLLSATVLFVLFIACANLANLLLTRGLGRRSELALRIAIGASRWRIIRQLALESLLISVAGGALGIFLASYGLKTLPVLLPPGSLPRLNEIRVHPVALVVAIGLSLLTGLVSGLFSASGATALNINEDLRQAGHGVIRASRARGRGFLIATEVSIALLLLVCAGLMIRTLMELNGVNPGFEARNLLSMDVFAPADDKNADRRIGVFDQVADTLSSLPGVERVSAVNHLPIGGDVWTLRYVVPGRPAPPPGEEPGAIYRVIRPGYFATMKIAQLRGREFSKRDDARSAPVVIVNEKLARTEWPAGAIGQTLEVPGLPSQPTRFTVVGVVADARQSDWTSAPAPEFYVPYLQHAAGWDQNHETFVIRSRVSSASIRGQAESRVHAINAGVAVSDVAAMDQVIGDQLWRSRLSALLLAIFAAISLTLAAVGIYGVISYSVRQRRREIGIRLALGAPALHVVKIALAETMPAVAIGMAIGIAASAAATRLFSSLLYNVKPTDPLTISLVVVVLAGTSLLAGVVPAWKALRLNRVSTLRHE